MDVSAATWNTLSKLLDEALDLDPAARVTWLEQIAAAQPDVLPSLSKLLAAHARNETADLLQRLPEFKPSAPGAASDDNALKTGAAVGPYRLLRELGSGGMADVWLAERADGAFERKVALKLPRVTRLRRDLAARFARERDILARLEHPNIARLYDAGIAADGLPYLAMEYIDGQPITTYCDDRRLDVKARLRLFVQVLDAVQYAHANLVIHRDLKPSNVLVTSQGQVRLLDFGIAKLLGGDDIAQETQLTQLAGRALTPDYASPEQIKGEPLTIATDVYSLGVVLYEVLTGSRPYKLKLQSAAQLEEAILAAEVQRPSAAVQAYAASARAATPGTLARALAGDLDTILLKTLAPSPVDRYRTMAALADDVLRHLDRRPIAALAPSLRYRARKFVRRHALPVAAGAAVAVSLVIATAVSVQQARVAREQTAVAQREAQRATAVQTFLLDLFRTNTDAQPDPVRARETTARELLDIGAARVAQQLHDVPEARDDVLGTLVDMYRSLGLSEREAAMQRERVALHRRRYGDDHPRVAESLIALASMLETTPERNQAPALLEQARTIVAARADTPPAVRGGLFIELARADMYTNVTRMKSHATEAIAALDDESAPQTLRANALRMSATAHKFLGEIEPAIAFGTRALETIRRTEPRPFNLELSIRAELPDSLLQRGDIALAEQMLRELLAATMQRNGATHIDTIHVLIRLAIVLHATERRTEARQLTDQALANLNAGQLTVPSLVAYVQRNVSGWLFTDGRFTAAEQWTRDSLDQMRRNHSGTILLARMQLQRGAVLTELGRFDEAKALLDDALQGLRTAMGPALQPLGEHRFAYARARLMLITGQAQEAVALLQSLQAPLDAAALPSPFERVRNRVLWSAALLSAGDTPGALAQAQQALKAVQTSPLRPYFSALEADAGLRLGQAELRAGRFAEAQVALTQAVALRSDLDHSESPWLAEAELALAEALAAGGARQRAAALVKQAEQRLAAHPALGAHYKRMLDQARTRLSNGR
jgi:serine/threonine-protein kinase